MYNIRKNTKRESFKPQVVWIDNGSYRMLLIQLPGFKREEIRVQLDNAGKLFIKGSRLTEENKYIDVDQSFDVPKDVITDKISAEFEDGSLVLIMPKKENTVTNEAKKEEVSKQEATKVEEPKQEEDKHEPGKIGREEKNGNTNEEKTTSNEAMQNEANQKEKSRKRKRNEKSQITDAMHNEPTQEKEKESAGPETTQNELNSETKAKETPKKNFDSNNNKDEDVENLKAKSNEGIIHQEEKKVEKAIEEIKENSVEKVKEISSQVKREKEERKEMMQKMKSKMNEIYRDTPKKIRKKINKMRQGEDGWLNSKYIDGAVEKVNRNRNIIAVAVMAFSVGLYVSHKLKARSG